MTRINKTFVHFTLEYGKEEENLEDQVKELFQDDGRIILLIW